MNTRHPVVSLRFALLLLALLAPAVLAQAPSDGTALPKGIEATGDTVEVRALHAWVEEHRYNQPEQARQAAERALALARELDDRPGVAKGLLILGHLVFWTDLSEAEGYYTEAQALFEEIGDTHGVFASQLGMGNVYDDQEKMEQALDAYFDALKGFERLGATESQAIALNNIGRVHKRQGNFDEAGRYYEQSIALAETIDAPDLLVINLINLAGLLVERGAYEDAEVQQRRALAISEEQGYRRYIASISNNLAHVFSRQGFYERALPFLLTAENLAKEFGNVELQASVYDEFAKAYLGLGEHDRALHYAGEGLALARARKSMTDQMAAHETLSRIYKAAGDPGQALTHYEAYMAARDSVFNAEKAAIVSEMQTRYETEEQKRANERLAQENRIQALQLTLLLAGVGGLLLILGVLFYRYRLKQRANRLLEELDAAKFRFFANISHEFRTPLTVILGGLKDNIAGRYHRDMKRFTGEQYAMLRNSRQLQRLIDEVLDLNRLEAGKLEFQPAPGDLVRSLRRIVEADAPLAERNDIDLTFDHDVEQCPRLYDQEKLEKIVGNLLSNALKFTPKGGSVRVSLTCGQETEIIVSDDGPGIPAEMREKVFERFAQLEDGSLHGGLSAVPGTAQAGTGIGLALAKELTELHGGTISLESEPGRGSTFTVRLPLEKTTLDEIEAPLQQNTEPLLPEEFDVSGDGHERRQDVGATLVVAQQTEETNNDPDRTTVLIIEDNDDVRAFVRRSLEESYRVLEAAAGEVGLQQAREALPDLIVSDVMLPGIDGYEVARRLKAEQETECIPVMMLTARAAEEDQTEGYGSGAEVYITKPFAPETLRAACARLLEERLRLRRRLQENPKQEGEKDARNGYSAFLNHAHTAVLENIYDEDFGVEELAAALNVSRRTLYNRFKAEGDLSPGDFIWNLRLKHARELLSGREGAVSEVAYAVGFKSLSHFTRSFHERYGELPSEHLGQGKKI